MDLAEKLNVHCAIDENAENIADLVLIDAGDEILLTNSEVEIQCTGEDKFFAKSINIKKFSDISCQKIPRPYKPELRSLNRQCGTGERYGIGFVVNKETFVPTIEL